MIILGIDPGSTRIGYGIVRWDNNKATCLAYGTFDYPGTHSAPRFLAVEQELSKLIAAHAPDRAGIEKLFFAKNQTTAMAVSEMRGVIRLTLARHNIPLAECTPLQVKQSITNYGKADKAQVQRMVRLLLNIREPIRPDDAADALAVALYCATDRSLWNTCGILD